ncbi:MAG TPA: SDR family oxidoreductase [Bacteroidia bacterium]|nr:SDR family oxidoreductase [Bacteroidia bacterium]
MKEKVVIITGASSGIGKACAIRFAKAGASIVMAGRNELKLKEAENEVRKIHSNVFSWTCDVSNENDCRKLILAAESRFKKIDVLINNAGISMRALFEETDLSVLKKLMDTNFWGTVYCTKYAIPYLLKVKGSVVGISSVAGKKGLPGRSGYSASKFAMEGFLETLRIENLKKNLHVLVACPGFTTSNIRNTALSKDGNMQGESPRDESEMMSAEEVAGHILHAVKKRKRDLILTRNGKLTVLLNKFFPSYMDKVVYNHMAKEKGSPFK